MQLVRDNYIRESGSGDSWHVDIDLPERPLKSYFEESISTIDYIYSNKVGNLCLFYSGGVDSQYLFCLLLKMGIKFTPVIIQLNGENGQIYNYHDIKYAFDFCECSNIKSVIFEINFDKFVKSGKIIDIASSAECHSYNLPATMYAFSQIDGFIISGNEPSLKYDSKNKKWDLEETQLIHSILRFFRQNKLDGSPFTLSYSSEMMFSFLLDPTIKRLANNEFPGKLGSNSSKSHVYNNGSGFNIPVYDFVSQTRVKYTGYELIKESEIANHPNMLIFKEFKNMWAGVHLVDYNTLVGPLL